jgi:putative ABC transport system permease protein
MVNDIDVTAGRMLTAGDAGRAVGLLEHHFADFYDLPVGREVVLAGGTALEMVGRALTPEYFIVTGERGGFLAESNYAAVFVPLATAQSISGHRDEVNDLVLVLAAGTDRDGYQDRLEAALAESLPDVSATVTSRDDEKAYRVLYDDVSSDEQFWVVLSGLILLAAFFAAFNLISRMVESQRREIGVGMALGVSPRALATRPLLVGIQVAVAGAVLGIGVGLAVGAAMRELLVDLLPLPIWLTPLQVRPYLRATALGMTLPILASLIPVRRAVRVEPVDAIRPVHLAVHRGGLVRALRRIIPPGRVLGRLPVRDLVRNPRRTVLTAAGVGAALSALVGVSGLLDTFLLVIDRGEREITARSPDRIDIVLETFVPVTDPVVTGLTALPEIGEAQPVLRIPTTLTAGDVELLTETTVTDLAGAVWHPTVDPLPALAETGVYVTAKAAHDLDVSVGDTLVMRHPRRTTGSAYTLVASTVTVAGIHPSPLRLLVYMDTPAGSLFGLEGLTNAIYANPTAGAGVERAERAVFGREGVASAQAARTATEQFGRLLDQFEGFLRIAQVAVLVMALMIAFNTSRITVDERAREHATMFAFGVPVRTVLAKIAAESMLLGVIGGAVGVAGGALMTSWFVRSLLPTTAPDIGLTPHISTETVVTAFVVGVIAVGVAPLLTLRKLTRMDLPATLRLVE